jgi:hypothetical protein
MKKYACIAILNLTLMIHSASGQSPVWVWAAGHGGIYTDYGFSITTDGSGNVLATGSFSNDTIFFGSTALLNEGSRDVFIVKYDNSGNVFWAKSGGGISADEGFDIATDASGNVYVTGVFRGPSITFNTTTLINSGGAEIFLVKYDSNGNLLWAKRAGGINDEEGNGICTDNSGNVILTGYFRSPSVAFDTINLNNSGEKDVFTVKYDASGNVLWARSSMGSASDYSKSITTDNSGNVYITGSFVSSSVTFGSAVLTNQGNLDDVFIVKYDSTGNTIWARSAAGNSNDYSNGIATDVNGNVNITGFFGSDSITFGSSTLINTGALGSGDIFTVQYDTNGNLNWARSEGGSDLEFSTGIATDALGNIYVTANFRSSSLTFGTTIFTNYGNYDALIVKYDAGGNFIEAANAYSPGQDNSSGIATDAFGNVYIIGYYISSFMNFGTTTLTNNGPGINSSDIFVAKLSTTTGLEDELRSDNLQVYPNPSSGQIYVRSMNTMNGDLGIYTLTGQKIYSRYFNPDNNLQTIDLDASSGVYLLRVEGEDFTATKKIIILK